MTHPNDDKDVEPHAAPTTGTAPSVFSDTLLATPSVVGGPTPLDETDSYYSHAFAEEVIVEEPPTFWNNPETAVPGVDPGAPAVPPTPAPFVVEPMGETTHPDDPSHPEVDSVDPELTAQVARAAEAESFEEAEPYEEIAPSAAMDDVDPSYEDEEALVYESAAVPTPVAADGGWTIPFLCAGIGLIACCLIIPLADENRRLNYDRLRLRADLDHLRQQARVNDEFIHKVNDDPSLAERLAQRQMKQIRAGTKVLDLPQTGGNDMSPFQITAVPPPPPLAPYRSIGGHMAALCYDPRSRLYVMGAGLLMMAVGLVLGHVRF